MLARSRRTVSPLAQALPAFDEPALRRLIFHAEEKGLAGAVVRVGRRVYFDIDRFNRWLEKQRGLQPGEAPRVSIPKQGPSKSHSRISR